MLIIHQLGFFWWLKSKLAIYHASEPIPVHLFYQNDTNEMNVQIISLALICKFWPSSTLLVLQDLQDDNYRRLRRISTYLAYKTIREAIRVGKLCSSVPNFKCIFSHNIAFVMKFLWVSMCVTLGKYLHIFHFHMTYVLCYWRTKI